MATGNSYSPCVTYDPPIGRLGIRGKIRADVDAIRAQVSMVQHGMGIKNRETDMAEKTVDYNTYTLYLKTISETRLLDQKAVTELAQTSDYIPAGIGENTSTDVQGMIEKQKNLFEKQKEGYDRDSEQKLAKIMVDTWTIRQTTDGETSLDAGVDNSSIKSVLQKAKSGVGVV